MLRAALRPFITGRWFFMLSLVRQSPQHAGQKVCPRESFAHLRNSICAHVELCSAARMRGIQDLSFALTNSKKMKHYSSSNSHSATRSAHSPPAGWRQAFTGSRKRMSHRVRWPRPLPVSSHAAPPGSSASWSTTPCPRMATRHQHRMRQQACSSYNASTASSAAP